MVNHGSTADRAEAKDQGGVSILFQDADVYELIGYRCSLCHISKVSYFGQDLKSGSSTILMACRRSVRPKERTTTRGDVTDVVGSHHHPPCPKSNRNRISRSPMLIPYID